MKTSSSATPLIAIIAIAGAATAGFATGPAFGQTAPGAGENFEFKFVYDQAELATVESAEKLLVRLQKEVRLHCVGSQPMNLETRARSAECTKETMSQSIDKFRSPALAQAYETRSGG